MSRAVASPLRDVNGAAARRPVRLKRRALSDSSDDDASDEDAPAPATNVDAVAGDAQAPAIEGQGRRAEV